jgi:hypothetical protein
METNLMQKIMIGTLMALVFGLFSMPASQAAPANGVSIGSAFKVVTPLQDVQWRRRRSRRRRRCRHRWRSRNSCSWW